MDENIRIELGGVADEVLELAERLIGVGENLNRLTRRGAGGESAWMAGARAELDELIRSVEG